MSRVGKKPILIPQGVEIKIQGNKVTVKGPKGEISKDFRPEISIEMKEDKIFVLPQKEILEKKKIPGRKAKQVKSLWGMTRMMIENMVKGVVSDFEKKLEIEGVGFKAEVVGQEVSLSVGFSEPVKIKIPEGLNVSVQKNVIAISGIKKDLVGQFASILRKVKPAEPYKGKGLRYQGEIIRRKVGKKVVTAGGK
ncbi:MAG: 50S ribosomal protein L6 [Candidatus Nealsonbacteria bacterium RBG_13_38_11]|uniref:Large ribosomal subunit protein uL6 n=1 Tax=Candidatus Nealsonbacteria bacterium RBG_13_38_11 TaxID=1801662 RepID=A0A1G2DY42_9BACT|nr:MAG: 50S ribosomal protein L6 [Candidatus Nealsonbacteria bacterium RBG_13_38_11]HXK32281.1 50S ribosomal protein L6 [Candidatus Paceibacterota bacterium]